MPLTDIETVIVQAGGRGSRLGSLTKNRPKCLLSVDGKPLLSWTVCCFPSARIVVIGDYQYESLRKYLEIFGKEREFRLVRARGAGDAAGLDAALDEAKEGPLAVVWSDLLIRELPEMDVASHHYIGLSRQFECRWSFDGKRCVETPSADVGILGFFTFTSPKHLQPLPEGGDFVAALNSKSVELQPVWLDRVVEVGDLATYRSINQPIGRPYNSIKFHEDTIVKTCSDPRYQYKVVAEAGWYEQVRRLGFTQVPHLSSANPLTLERIRGRHPMDLHLDRREKQRLIEALLQALETLHRLGSAPFSLDACCAAHLTTPFKALGTVRELLPKDGELTINGERCLNPLVDSRLLDACGNSFTHRSFCVIHGECTFSNTLVTQSGEVYFIDPAAGYGDCPPPFGNPLYDWTKLYYSVAGRYDQFNRKRFELTLGKQNVSLEIAPSGWEEMTPLLEERFADQLNEIRLMHALEWFLLAGHSTDDYDAILAAFYRGVWLLHHALEQAG